jgi:hypothetical protein
MKREQGARGKTSGGLNEAMGGRGTRRQDACDFSGWTKLPLVMDIRWVLLSYLTIFDL